MEMRARFSPEEWSTVTEAPLQAATRVIGADPGGSIRESLSIRRVYAAARGLRGESPLLDELVASSPSVGLQHLRGDADPLAAGDARLRSALAILAGKASSQDVDAYKGFVLAVVHTVAEANREGGFLGVGGEEVSAREQAALDEIAALMELG
jgi:hypothetical protein